MHSTRILRVLALPLAFLYLLAVASPLAAQIGDEQNRQHLQYKLASLETTALIDHDSSPPEGCSTRCGIVLYPNHLTFAAQPVGTTSKAQAVSLINSLPFSISVGISITGPFHETNTCPTTLPVHHGCGFEVTFRPKLPGPANGYLRVRVNGSLYSVPLSGTGK